MELWLSWLDFQARRDHCVTVRPQIIKAILIGICITVLGIASFVIDECFFPFTTIQTAKGIDYLLTVVFAVVFSPTFILGPWIGDPTDISCIVAASIFWSGVVFILLKAIQAIKHSLPRPNR
jgi:hypothetical protein